MSYGLNNNEEVWDLSLFVAGRENPNSVIAFSNLKRICEEHLPGSYNLQVIDITDSSDIANTENIIAVPTLIRNVPAPRRTIIGDLSNTDRVLVSLGVRAPSPVLSSNLQ